MWERQISCVHARSGAAHESDVGDALATVVLVLGASVTAWYAIKTYQDQSKQARILLDQMMRDTEYRRRAQASQVFVWVEDRPYDGNPDDMRAAACIGNTSNQPVYDIVLGLG